MNSPVMNLPMMKRFYFFFMLLLLVLTGVAQKNILNDSWFEQPYAINSAVTTNQWIHILNSGMVNGEIYRTLPAGFTDSVLYCKVAYKSQDMNGRNNCQIVQRITGLKQKKYRLAFWVWTSSRDIYYTAEVNFLNENYTNESGTRAAQLIAQSASSGAGNYHIPGNWKLQTLDIDFTAVDDPKRLDVVRFAFFPNCNNGTTITREAEYYLAAPLLYEVNETTKDYFADGNFESWDITGLQPVAGYWQVNAGPDACAKRGPGHRDTDYAMVVTTGGEKDGTTIETVPGSLRIPRSTIDLSFYARSDDASAALKVYLGSTDLGKISLTDNWKRYVLTIDYSAIDASTPDVLRFELLNKAAYSIDACRLERQDGVTEADAPVAGAHQRIVVSSQSDTGSGSLRQAVLDALDGDTILIPGNFEIVLHSALTINKSVVVDGQGATIRVNEPGVTKQKLIVIGNGANDTGVTASTVTLKDVLLKPGNVTGSHATVSNVANCGAGITLFNYSKLITHGVTIDGGKGDYAGAIHVNHSSSAIQLFNSVFRNNEATSSNGGAIMLKGDALVEGCLFEGNRAKQNGSALATYNTGNIRNTIFRTNEAQGVVGGAVVNYSQTNGIVTVSGCLFDSNVCSNTSGGGGAIAANHNQSTTFISNSTFANNSGTSAGAVYFVTNSSVATAGAMNFINNTFTGNTAAGTAPGALVINNTRTSDYSFSILLINNIFAYNYNANGLLDVSAQNTSLYNLSGSNNIKGISEGLDELQATLPFSYAPESDLFKNLEVSQPRKPVLDADGTVKLSGNTSIAFAAGFAYGHFEPELIPGLDQLGVKRATVPCVGAYEWLPGQWTALQSTANPELNLYPNPTSGILHLSNGANIRSLRVTNLLGQPVFHEKGNLTNIDIRQLDSGMYLMQVETEEGKFVQRIHLKK